MALCSRFRALSSGPKPPMQIDSSAIPDHLGIKLLGWMFRFPPEFQDTAPSSPSLLQCGVPAPELFPPSLG